VVNPFAYIKKIINFVDIFLFHFESNNKLTDIIKEVKIHNKQVGIAINPMTNVDDIVPYLNKVDLVLIMSVQPGWSGQKFINASIEKVNNLSQYKKKYNFIIDIDGGIDLTNAKQLKNTDILTSASTILKAEDPNKIIKLLKYSDENE
jgi:ribulose-phosphate 3-epimerase